MFKGILPYDKIEGGDAQALGNFAAFSESLFALAGELDGARTLMEWEDLLTRVLDDFFLADEDTERDLLFIRRVLRDLGQKQELSGFDEKLPLGVIKSHLGGLPGERRFRIWLFDRRAHLLRHAAHEKHPFSGNRPSGDER